MSHVVHFSLPLFGVGLGKSDVSTSCYVSSLADSVGAKNVEIGSLLKLLTIIGDVLLLGDYSNTFTSIQSFVCYLNLEWELLDLCKVNIIHLN